MCWARELGDREKEKAMTSVKEIRLVCERPEVDKEVEVMPKDTVDDVLRKAGLSPADYAVMKPDNESRFNAGSVIWDDIGDGDKLHLVAMSTVGSSVWARLAEMVTGGARKRPSSSFAEMNGWKSVGMTIRGRRFEGYFWAKGYRWRGEAIKKLDGYVDMFIWNPPMNAIRSSNFGACFHPTDQRNKWLVNVKSQATNFKIVDLNAGVAAVNDMLSIVFRAAAKTA